VQHYAALHLGHGGLDLRRRRYVSQQWFSLLGPLLRYSYFCDAYILRGVGRHVGPVLSLERRRRIGIPSDGIERRAERLALYTGPLRRA
jgi:hypothetical protein